MRNRSIIGIGMLCLVLFSADLQAQDPPPAAWSFAVGPMVVRLTAPHGGTAQGEFTVVSTGGEKIARFGIEKYDLNQNLDGTVEPTTIGGGTRSCADWISFDTSITLQPGGRATVPFSVSVPPDAQGMYHAMITVQHRPEQVAGPMVLNIQTAVAVRVELEIPGSAPLHVDVTDMKVERSGGESFVGFTAKNTGVWTAQVEGDVLFYGATGTFPLRVPIPYRQSGDPVKIYPGMAVALRCPLPRALAPGDYRAVSRLMLNGRWPARGEFELTVGAEGGDGQWGGVQTSKTEHDLDLAIEPDLVELSLPPGGSRVIPIKLLNRDRREARIRFDVSGLKMEASGAFTFATGNGATSWVSVDTSEIILPPGRTTVVKARAVVPKERTDYGSIVCAVRVRASTTGDGQWQSGLERPVLVVATGPRAAPASLELDNPELIRLDPDENPTAAVVHLRNVGQRAARFEGSLVLSRDSGEKILTMEIGAMSTELILPGGEREFRIQVPPLDNGRFTVRAEFKSLGSSGQTTFAQTSFVSDVRVPSGL